MVKVKGESGDSSISFALISSLIYPRLFILNPKIKKNQFKPPHIYT